MLQQPSRKPTRKDSNVMASTILRPLRMRLEENAFPYNRANNTPQLENVSTSRPPRICNRNTTSAVCDTCGMEISRLLIGENNSQDKVRVPGPRPKWRHGK